VIDTFVLTDAYILRAREKRYSGFSDLTTEHALAWCLPKHPHSLSVIHEACRWCKVERLCFEAVHPASKTPDAPWWNELVDLANRERGDMMCGGGYRLSYIRLDHSDGRWWVAIVVDPLNSPDSSELSVGTL